MREYPTFDDFLFSQLRNKEDAKIFLDIALEEYEEDGDLHELLRCLEKVAEARGQLDKLPAHGEELRAQVSSGAAIEKEINVLLRTLGFRLGVVI